MSDLTFPGASDWRSQPDAFEKLAALTGEALVSPDPGSFVPLLDEVDPLLDAGQENFASAIVTAAVFRALRGPASRSTDIERDVVGLPLDDATIRSVGELPGNDALVARILEAIAKLDVERGQMPHAVSLLQQAADRWARAGDDTRHASSLLGLGTAAGEIARYGLAVSATEEARNLFARVRDGRGEALALLNLVRLAASQQDSASVESWLAAARSIASRLRDPRINASIAIEEGIVEAEAGHTGQAKRLFARARRSAQRRADHDQLTIAATNLALIAQEADDTAEALRWWSEATHAAAAAEDWQAELESISSEAILLAREERFSEAVAAFDRALAIAHTHADERAVARVRADRGAATLQQAFNEDLSDDQFERRVAAAAEEIDAARHSLEEIGDLPWAESAVRNLSTAWAVDGTGEHRLATLRADAERFRRNHPDYAAELLRNAVWLGLRTGQTATADAVDQFVSAVTLEADTRTDRAARLSIESATAQQRGYPELALALADAALDHANRADDPSTYGNILNDSALIALELDRDDDAGQRLERARTVARESEDRALLALASANLAETRVRARDEAAATSLFAEAGELFVDIGDLAQAAAAYSSAANAHLATGSHDEAVRDATRALNLALDSRSGDAIARAKSANASIAYARGDYEHAYSLWKDAATSVEPEDAGEYKVFALDCLARLGGWGRFKRDLDRYAKAAQDQHTQLSFIGKLHLPALTWLRQERPRAAGTVLAYAVLLAFDAMTKRVGSQARAHTDREREREIIKISGALGIARAMLVLIDMPESGRAELRTAYEGTIRRAAGEDAVLIIETVDELVRSEAGEEEHL